MDDPLDSLGWRAKFGVLAPSTNTIVEADFYRMAPPGVTCHMSRIHIRDMSMNSDDDFLRVISQIRAEIAFAIERVVTCEPDYLVMGMSAETFWGGVEGNERFTADVSRQAGCEVATGADACRRALEVYEARKIAVLTPYQKVADDNVERFFTESGYEVVGVEGLRCPSAVAIAQVTEAELRARLIALSNLDVDAVVQVGTNLSMVRLADEAERWLGKPIVAINAATFWMALRDNQIADKVYGAGRLLRDW